MAAFNDQLDLRTAVVEHVGSADFVDVFPRLVLMAETQINRRLRCREQITSDTLTVASGVAALPDDFAEMIGVYSAAGLEYIAQPLAAVKLSDSQGYYTISGSNLVTVGDGDLAIEYYAKVPTITTSVTTSNWLLESAPGLYLYAVGLEAAKHMRNVELAQATAQLAEMEYKAVISFDNAQRFSRARVRVQGVVP